MSAFLTPDQFRSSNLSRWLHIALTLDSESDSISRSLISFCFSASRIAQSSALEFEAGFSTWLVILKEIFLALPSSYQNAYSYCRVFSPVADRKSVRTFHNLTGISCIFYFFFLVERGGNSS